MAAKTGVTVDSSTLIAGLKRFEQILPKVGEETLKPVGLEVLKDAVQDLPQAPIKISFLRGSGAVWVNNKFVQGPRYGLISDKSMAASAMQPSTRRDFSKITECVQAFLEDYSAYQHEGISHAGRPLDYKRSGTGAKFLEKSFTSNRNKYLIMIQRMYAQKLAQLF